LARRTADRRQLAGGGASATASCSVGSSRFRRAPVPGTECRPCPADAGESDASAHVKTGSKQDATGSLVNGVLLVYFPAVFGRSDGGKFVVTSGEWP